MSLRRGIALGAGVGLALAAAATALIVVLGDERSGLKSRDGARRASDLAIGFTGTALVHPPVLPPETVFGTQAQINPDGLIRFTLQWRVAQPEPDTAPDFAEYDKYIVEPARELGLQPVITIMAAPEWAWGDGTCDESLGADFRGYCFMPPGDDAANMRHWHDFVGDVARHYESEAYAIEIWNEENIGTFWHDREGIDPERYAQMLCAADAAVEKESPEVPVVLGGMATPSEPAADRVGVADFLSGVYEGGGGCMDALGVHPYPGQTSPAQPGGPVLTALDEARTVRDANGDEALPLWITEFGAPTVGPNAVSEEEQAVMLSCGLALAGEMPDVEVFLLHTLVDGGNAEGPASYGVYRAPSPGGAIVPKPAAVALAAMLAENGGLPSSAESC